MTDASGANDAAPDEQTAIDLAEEHDATTATPRGIGRRPLRPAARVACRRTSSNASSRARRRCRCPSRTTATTTRWASLRSMRRERHLRSIRPAAPRADDSVFLATPDAPATSDVASTTRRSPGATRRSRRSSSAAARKLKRVLADEQNEVLHALRRREPVRERRRDPAGRGRSRRSLRRAIEAELVDAAVAGAVSMGASAAAAKRDVKKAAATTRRPPRRSAPTSSHRCATRLERSVGDADGDNAELADLVRVLYREWKSAAHRRAPRRRRPRRVRAWRARRRRRGHADPLDRRPERSRLPRRRGQRARGRRRGRRAVPDRSRLRPCAQRVHVHDRAARATAPQLTDAGIGRRPARDCTPVTSAHHADTLRSASSPSARTRRVGDRGRVALIVAAVLLVVLLLSARTLSGFYIDYLWHDSVDRSDVFWGVLGSKVFLFVGRRRGLHHDRGRQPADRRSARAEHVLGEHAPGRRAVPRDLRSPPAPRPLRARGPVRAAVRAAGDRPLAGVAAVPQQPVVRHPRTRSSATTSASTSSSCRSSPSCSTGCTPR